MNSYIDNNNSSNNNSNNGCTSGSNINYNYNYNCLNISYSTEDLQVPYGVVPEIDIHHYNITFYKCYKLLENNINDLRDLIKLGNLKGIYYNNLPHEIQSYGLYKYIDNSNYSFEDFIIKATSKVLKKEQQCSDSKLLPNRWNIPIKRINQFHSFIPNFIPLTNDRYINNLTSFEKKIKLIQQQDIQINNNNNNSNKGIKTNKDKIKIKKKINSNKKKYKNKLKYKSNNKYKYKNKNINK